MKRYELSILVAELVHRWETDSLERALEWKRHTYGKGAIWDRIEHKFVHPEENSLERSG